VTGPAKVPHSIITDLMTVSLACSNNPNQVIARSTSANWNKK